MPTLQIPFVLRASSNALVFLVTGNGFTPGAICEVSFKPTLSPVGGAFGFANPDTGALNIWGEILPALPPGTPITFTCIQVTKDSQGNQIQTPTNSVVHNAP